MAAGGEEYGSHLAADAFVIAMEPAGHWHVTRSKTLLFTVTDAATGQPASVKNLVVQITQAGSSRVTQRSVDAGQVVFQGDGVYSLDYTAANLVPHAFSARFEDEGQVFASEAWVVEIAKDGEEGIKRTVNGVDYVYQVRFYWDPGHAHASDTGAVNMNFEIMRGIQEGGDINWEQPWRNTFNHITGAVDPVVEILTNDGTVSENVTPTYRGKGEYRGERIFTVAEVGADGRDYEVTFSFTDPYNGAVVSNEEPYSLHLSAPH